MTDEIIAFKGEAMLLNWNESKQGRTVVFQLDEEADQHPFKQFTTKKGKRAGQRFMAVFVEIGDDEQPIVHEKKGGPLSQSAAMLCDTQEFRCFLLEKILGMPGRNFKSFPETHWADVVRKYCGVTSRAELDHNEQAAKLFHKLVAEYRAWTARITEWEVESL